MLRREKTSSQVGYRSARGQANRTLHSPLTLTTGRKSYMHHQYKNVLIVLLLLLTDLYALQERRMTRRRRCTVCDRKFRPAQMAEHLARDHSQPDPPPSMPTEAATGETETGSITATEPPQSVTRAELKVNVRSAIEEVYPFMCEDVPYASLERLLKAKYQKLNWVARDVIIHTATWLIDKHRKTVARINSLCGFPAEEGTERRRSRSRSSSSSSSSTSRSRSSNSSIRERQEQVTQECQPEIEFPELTKEQALQPPVMQQQEGTPATAQQEAREAIEAIKGTSAEPVQELRKKTPKEESTPWKVLSTVGAQTLGRRKKATTTLQPTPSRELNPPTEKERERMNIPKKPEGSRAPRTMTPAAGAITSPRKGRSTGDSQRSTQRTPTGERSRSRRQSPSRGRSSSRRSRSPPRHLPERHPSLPFTREWKIPRSGGRPAFPNIPRGIPPPAPPSREELRQMQRMIDWFGDGGPERRQ